MLPLLRANCRKVTMKIPHHSNPELSLIIPEEDFGVEIIPLTRKEKRKYRMRFVHTLLILAFALYLLYSGRSVGAKTFEELTRADMMPLTSWGVAILLFVIIIFKSMIDLLSRPNIYDNAINEMTKRRITWENNHLIPYLNKAYGLDILTLNLNEEDGVENHGVARQTNDSEPFNLIQGGAGPKFPIHIEGISYTQDDRFPSDYDGAKPYRVAVDMDSLQVFGIQPKEFIALEKD